MEFKSAASLAFSASTAEDVLRDMSQIRAPTPRLTLRQLAQMILVNGMMLLEYGGQSMEVQWANLKLLKRETIKFV